MKFEKKGRGWKKDRRETVDKICPPFGPKASGKIRRSWGRGIVGECKMDLEPPGIAEEIGKSSKVPCPAIESFQGDSAGERVRQGFKTVARNGV